MITGPAGRSKFGRIDKAGQGILGKYRVTLYQFEIAPTAVTGERYDDFRYGPQISQIFAEKEKEFLPTRPFSENLRSSAKSADAFSEFLRSRPRHGSRIPRST
jgi:hypothetical protein